MKKVKKILRGMVVISIMAFLVGSVVGSAYACIGDGLSPGFWKHNVGVYLGERNGSYSDPPVYSGQTPLVTKDSMGTWLAGLDDTIGGTLNLEELYDQLNTKGGGSDGAAIRVTAANVFNLAADLYPYSG